MKDYYSVLKISRSANSIEIKAAYRSLSKQFHPDVNKAPNASSIFIEIKEAYEVLIDDARRIHYNQLLDYAFQKQNQQINSTPKISVFYYDNAEFSVGDVVTFTWEVSDADVVELRPFGKVANSGTKKIRITDVSTNLLVELFCYNSMSKNYVFSQIILKKRENFQNQSLNNNKTKQQNHFNPISKLAKCAFGTAIFNIALIFLFFLIPKEEVSEKVIKYYGRLLQTGKSPQWHHFIKTDSGEFEISETMGNLYAVYKPEFIYLGKNPITDNVSFVRIFAGGEEITHYISVVDFNSPIPILYFLFLLFEYYVIFTDKKMRIEKQYDSTLIFIIIVNLAYFFFFIL
ncbi:hypothetical protein EG240_14985 [Paenimyroides tangerinum]|uniref:J domain-containing protein n=1 Tax=Paenimyroides tangerinum TaxID=2488728 RepID=A0A3P3W0K8_9FLAO|nr:DnaJ domain-containing protein [Paenimyroides tangerinum]RRJ87416.1 hypothetical protein EG240_14985 [Paenimyroides tangerinum]